MTKARERTGKVRHETKAGALAQSGTLRRRFLATASTAHVYRCKWCAGFHVGHRPRRGRRR